MNKEGKMFAVAVIMAVAALSLSAVLMDCGEEESDAALLTSSVDIGAKATSVGSTGIYLRDDDDNVWASNGITIDPKKGETVSTLTITPWVRLSKNVWNDGTGTSDCDRMTIKVIEYFDDGSASTSYKQIYMYGHSVGQTLTFDSFTFTKSSTHTKIVFTYSLWNSSDEEVFDVINPSYIVDLQCGTRYTFDVEVKYNINGGVGGPTSSTKLSETYSSAVWSIPVTLSSVNDMARENYIFKGWGTSTDATTLYAPGSTFNAKDTVTTLYAVWEATTVSVSFSSNGSIIDTQTVNSGSTVTPINPELDGYTFKGWYTDNTFSTLFDFSTTITSDITLFAKWEGNFAFTSEPTADGNVRVLSSMDGTVVFDASGSEGSMIVWDFGDGTTATGMYQTHFYSQPGTYQVKLLVYNDNGDVDMKEYSIEISNEAAGGGDFDVRLLLIVLLCIIGGDLVIRRLL